ncbi:MAG TPA: hypothetical protein VFO34_03145 [Candidatus Acidoferrales bacterium]|nr:hypothetical protein [Candidatus Acidoferrales bacterium]
MKTPVTAAESTLDRTRRCAYTNKRGYRCTTTLPRSSDSLYCGMHAASLQRREREQTRALADELIQDFNDFGDPAEAHLLISRLFRMVAEDRISLRRASVLLQIGRHLNRTLRQLEDYVSKERPEAPAIKLSAWKWNFGSDGSVPCATTTSSPTGRREDPPSNTGLAS